MAAAVQHGGLSVTASQIADIRAAGATDLEIHDTVLIAAAFCTMNRYVDGLAAITRKTPPSTLRVRSGLSRTVMSRRQLKKMRPA